MTGNGRSLRLLVVGLRYPPYVAGGYELLTRDVVEGLRSRGHRVEVLCAQGQRFAGSEGVHPRLLPNLDQHRDLFEHSFRTSNRERFALHMLRGRNLWATGRLLRELEPDAVLYMNLSLLSVAPILAARLHGVATLGLVCDPWPENHWLRFWDQRAPEKPLRRQVLGRLWRILREGVRLEPMLVPSRSLLREFAADGLDPAGLRCLPLAMSPEMEALGQSFEPRARSSGEPLRVLCASYLWEGKGVHVLLEGAALAAGRGADLAIEVAGTGQEPYVGHLRTLAEDPRLGGRVRFLGTLSRAELSTAMGRNHVLAFPSLWGEPFALATLEAMGHGLALLGSDAGGTPEQARHGESGWIARAGDVPAWADALETLYRDEPLRMELARRGREHVYREHSQAAFLDRLEVELLELVPGSRG